MIMFSYILDALTNRNPVFSCPLVSLCFLCLDPPQLLYAILGGWFNQLGVSLLPRDHQNLAVWEALLCMPYGGHLILCFLVEHVLFFFFFYYSGITLLENF